MNWLCRLFGHKYVYLVYDYKLGYIPRHADFCVRCGHKPTNTKSTKKNTTLRSYLQFND